MTAFPILLRSHTIAAPAAEHARVPSTNISYAAIDTVVGQPKHYDARRGLISGAAQR